jgi:hypothetical protein
MAYIPENYVNDYNDTYGSILKHAMENTAIGVDTPLEKLFSLIDDSSSDTTALERLSMKKEAYMQMLGTLSAQSQQTAIALVDKKYGFSNELEMMEQKIIGEKIKNGYSQDISGDWVQDVENSEAHLANKVKKAQIALTKRQAEAFDDNKDKEILKVAMEGHAMLFETVQDDSVVIPNWYTSAEDHITNGPGFNTLMENARTTDEITL